MTQRTIQFNGTYAGILGALLTLAAIFPAMSAHGAPVNDECANATPIVLDTFMTGSTVSSTGTDITSCSESDTYDVWFTYTPPAPGVSIIELCGSSYDTTLAIFTGCEGIQVACNDDTEECAEAYHSKIFTTISESTTYYVRVAGYGGQTGNYSLFATLIPNAGILKGTVTSLGYDDATPSSLYGATVEVRDGATVLATDTTDYSGNYEFAGLAPGVYEMSCTAPWHTSAKVTGLIVTDGTTTTMDFSLRMAGNDDCIYSTYLWENDPRSGNTDAATGTSASACSSGDTKDVWFQYHPSASGLATISLCAGSSFDTTLSVFDTCGGTQLACNDDYCSTASQLELTVDLGMVYFVRVAGYQEASGDYSLLVTLSPGEGQAEGTIEGEGGAEGEGEGGGEGEGSPFTGACCLPNGSCMDGTGEDCDGWGGMYQGDGTTCAETICPIEGEGGGEGEGESSLTFDYVYQPDGSRQLSDPRLPSGTATLTDSRIDQDHCGFDFASATVIGLQSDVYFYGPFPGMFWANNGIGGLQDMGAVSLESITEAPTDGYNIGTPVNPGHTYCVLTKDAMHYAKFRVPGGEGEGEGGGEGEGEGSPYTGACCLPDGSCMDGTGEDCDRWGGMYQGDGTTCAETICPIEGEGGEEGEGEGEGESAPVICSGDSIFGQPVTDSPPGFFFFSDSVENQISYDNFTGVSGSVAGVIWWGLGFDSSQDVSCTRDNATFTINFFTNDAGLPGTLVHTTMAAAFVAGTGQTSGGLPIASFTAMLDVPVTLPEGWISIVGQDDMDCRFGWYIGTGGDDQHAQSNGGAPSIYGYDMAFCLLPGPGEGETEGVVEGEGIPEGQEEGEDPSEGYFEGSEEGEGGGEGAIEGEPGFECPLESLYGQPYSVPPGIEELPGSDASAGVCMFDDFSGLTGNILRVVWFGINVTSTYQACTRDTDSFTITFYEPGPEPIFSLNQYSVVPASTDTGLDFALGSFGPYPVFRYEAAFNYPCELTEGWVAIQASGDGHCFFSWLPGTGGNGASYAIGPLSQPINYDLSFCFISGSEGEGQLEGEGGVEGEGMAEGTVEGEGIAEGEGVAEGIAEGEGVTEGEGVSEGEGEDGFLTADQNQDNKISLSELLRVIQFFNSNGFHCQAGTEDGYAPGPGDTSCVPYDSDYNTLDWHINLSELLRVIQFFNSGGYHYCPEEGTEDGFCPGS